MLVAGGNGSFAQITAPLRVTLSQAGLRITGSDMCDCVYRRILRYITPPSFPCKHYGHILQMLGAFWVERYRKKTGQLKKRRNCFSQILQRQQIYLWISSLLSPPDFPRVDGRGLLRVQHIAAERQLGSELLYPCEMKQDRTEGSKLHIRNSEWWNTPGTKNCVTVDHADANYVILSFSDCEAPKWKTVEAGVQERCADDSLRGTGLILFSVFVFFCFLLSSNRVKVERLLTPSLNKADAGLWMQSQCKQCLLELI